MKKICFLAALGFAAVFTASAQSKADSVKITKRAEVKKEWKQENGDKMKAKKMDLKEELGLTDAQGQEVKKLNQEYGEKMKALRQNTTLSEDQKKEQLKSMNAERNAKLKTIVGPEKYAEMEQKRKAMREKAGERMKERKGKRATGAGK